METTKKCTCCGEEKSADKFYTNRNSEDGLSDICYSCAHKKRNKKVNTKGLNPALAEFQPRELIAELRARGYRGTLEYTQTINL